MKFHVLGLGHTKTNLDYLACAYTMKIWNFCKMMKSLGHEVIHYGNEGSCPECDEQVDMLSQDEFENIYGSKYHWHTFFKFDKYDRGWVEFLSRAEKEIRKRIKKGGKEFIVVFFGNYYETIEKADLGIFVEGGIGYTGWFARWKVWESYFWYAVNFGRTNDPATGWGDWYSVIIPNYFDPDMFEFSEQSGHYFLFVGRLIDSKGFRIIQEMSTHTDVPIKIAGQGDPSVLQLDKYPNLNYVGTVGLKERKVLYKDAIATFVPTYYMEPFGGVAIESQMSGTPVITTDWGAFTETVVHGITGFRCRTFQDFVEAIRKVCDLNRLDCRNWALRNFSIQRVQYMYSDYFEKILDVYNSKGWYEIRERIVKPLDWLNKWYPS